MVGHGRTQYRLVGHKKRSKWIDNDNGNQSCPLVALILP